MTRRVPLALALTGCLASPPDAIETPGADAAPGEEVRLLGVFSRDAFSRGSVLDDLVLAAAYHERIYLVHLRAAEGGLETALQEAEADELPFEPAALVGADVDADNSIDVIATSPTGDLAVLTSEPEGLVPFPREVVLDSGAPFEAITTIDAPDLAGEERVFLCGPQGIWMSDPLSDTDIHFDEINPRMTDVALPATFFATHDDVDTWYVGVAQGTAIDLWPITGFDRQTGSEIIGVASPEVPARGYWRRLPDPQRANFFGMLPGSNQVMWAQDAFGDTEASNLLDPGAVGPLRDLTMAQQIGGYDLITASEEPGGQVGVQVMPSLDSPADAPPIPVVLSLASSIDTDLSFWVQPLDILATPYAGKEILVFDEAGHVLCITFDADHTELSGCGEANLADHMPSWTGAG